MARDTYTPKPNETLGDYLRRCRILDDVSRRTVAKLSGVSISRVSSIEDGTTPNPGILTVAAMAATVDADAAILLNKCLPAGRSVRLHPPIIRLTDKVRAAGAVAGNCTEDEAETIFVAMTRAAGVDVSWPMDEDDETIVGDPCS